MPHPEIGLTADLHEWVGLDRLEEGPFRGRPCSGGHDVDVDFPAQAVSGAPGRLEQVIAVRAADDQDVDVTRGRSRLAGVPRGPGPVDVDCVDPLDPGQFLCKHMDRSVGVQDEVEQDRAHRLSGADADQPGAPDQPTGHQSGGLEAVNLVFDRVLVGADRRGQVGHRLLTWAEQQAGQDQCLGLGRNSGNNVTGAPRPRFDPVATRNRLPLMNNAVDQVYRSIAYEARVRLPRTTGPLPVRAASN